MASSYSEDLTCSICLTIFSDPVVLRCGHSFCRKCISLSLKSQPQCPQCRVPEKGQFTSNHNLKSLSEKAKENERSKRGSGADEAAGGFCPEHEEKLKLFCFTDRQLVCFICRDGEKHERHKFKPVKEAAASVRKGLEVILKRASSDKVTIEETANKQRDQLTKTKAKSQQLTSQISSQFEEMHRFLNKREEEIKKELKQKEEVEVNKMMDTLKKAEAALSEGVEMDRQVRAFLEMSDPEKFLKSWSKDNTVKTVKHSFRPEEINLQVVESSLSMMPYESHLQLSMLKDMLQVVQSRAERPTFTSQGPAITVSGDGRTSRSMQGERHGAPDPPLPTSTRPLGGERLSSTSRPENGESLEPREASKPEGAMASSYSEDLTCSICLTIFSDPVVLRCGHSFCRECISLSLKSQPQCPQCRVPEKGQFATNHILKSLSEKAKENERSKRGSGAEEAAGGFCPEHEEKLKLFCFTDQQLVCFICRDGEKHEGHQFKPVKEAAALVRKELEALLKQASSDIVTIEETANKQRDQLTKTKAKSQQLTSQISSQFEEMHRFLNKREEEIKKELKQKEEVEVNEMMDTLTKAEALSEGVNGKFRAFLEMSDPEKFLKSLSGDNKMKTVRNSFGPEEINLQVVESSLSLMPYESHLQFFVWKEMLQVVQPRAERLTFTSQGPAITVSGDGRSLVSACQQNHYPPPERAQVSHRTNQYYSPVVDSYTSSRGQGVINDQPTSVYSQNEFSSGQHYWEIDVGQKAYWELGVNQNFLKHNGSTYTLCKNNRARPVTIVHPSGSPNKTSQIGVYLNCSSRAISFYDAENMKLIHTITNCLISMPARAFLKIGSYEDYVPVTACWY
ncbi:nuclear factor 7, brain-like [Menidia menidia]